MYGTVNVREQITRLLKSSAAVITAARGYCVNPPNVYGSSVGLPGRYVGTLGNYA
jgi:hypothetical protein